jgi:hypothetical protein
MNETRCPTDRNTRLWMVGLRFRDASWQFFHHYNLVNAADPSQALDAACLRFCSAPERDYRKGARLDGRWCEVIEIINDFSGVRLRRNSDSLRFLLRHASESGFLLQVERDIADAGGRPLSLSF